MCEELLGVTSTETLHGRGGRISLTWLSTHFRDVMPDDAEDELIERTTRAYILVILGGWIFADKSSSLVHLMFLQLLRDFEQAEQYSWEGTYLAWLYRKLCRAA